MNTLSIVIPAYNEEENILAVVDCLFMARQRIVKETELEDVEIIVVNDGSTDDTEVYLQRCASLYPDLRLVSHVENQGYGAALKTGFKIATGTYVSFMDADGTITPDSLISMFHELEKKKADIVVGKRFGQSGSSMPLIRKIGNRFFACILSLLSGEKVGDTASGIRIFRREVIFQLYPLPDGLHFTPAMSSKAVHEKLRIVEVPIVYAERKGKSKLNIVADGIKFFRSILGTVLMYNPFKVFVLVGLFLEIVAGSLFCAPLYALVSKKSVVFSDYIYRSIGALYFFTAGIQIILFGILARFIVSTFFRRYEQGRFLQKLNDVVRIYDWMGVYGFSVFLVGVLINALYFWRYLIKGDLTIHWAWLLLAAGFIIVGLQMVITRIIMKILRDIRAQTTWDETKA